MVVKFIFFQSSLRCLTLAKSGLLEKFASKSRKDIVDCILHKKLYSGAMASSADVNRLKMQAEKAEAMISNLQQQINNVRKAAVKQAGLGEEEKLKKENEKLRKEIQTLSTALIVAEINNGVRQVPVPSKVAAAATITASLKSSRPIENGPSSAGSETDVQSKETAQKAKQKEEPLAGGKKAKTETKAKKGNSDGNKAKQTAGGAGDTTDASIDISRLDMRVGKIVAVEKHPKADKLYVEQVDLGEGKNRTVVSGLVDNVPISAMKDRIAVFMCNLKPVKMREIFSQGMIMCATSPEKTEILVPPPEAEIGDRIIFEDYPGVPDEQLNPKKKIWETLKPDVRTNKDRVATYKGCPFTIKGKGEVVAPTLADAQIS